MSSDIYDIYKVEREFDPLAEAAAFSQQQADSGIQRLVDEHTMLRVLGQDTDQTAQAAHNALDAKLTARQWGSLYDGTSRETLVQQLTAPLTPESYTVEAYSKGVEVFAYKARQAQKMHDSQTTSDAWTNAMKCLIKARDTGGWTTEQFETARAQIARFIFRSTYYGTEPNDEVFVKPTPEIPAVTEQNRVVSVDSDTVLPAVVPRSKRGIFGSVRSWYEARRSRQAVIGAAVGMVLVAALSPMMHTPHHTAPKPTKQSSSAKKHAVTSQIKPVAPATVPASAKPNTAKYYTVSMTKNDTVWHEAAVALGTHATQPQIATLTAKILAFNHISPAQAHTMHIGELLQIPSQS